MTPSDPVSEYLDRVESPARASLLRHVRDIIMSEAPEAVPVISYGLPAFRVPGGVVCGFAVTRSGCSLYPFSGTTVASLGALLDGSSTTKGAIHFDPDHPLPDEVVRQVVRLRLTEIGDRAG